jgi:hypothetical protein
MEAASVTRQSFSFPIFQGSGETEAEKGTPGASLMLEDYSPALIS